MNYLRKQATAKKSPQSQPIPGRQMDMTRNNAGGFAFKADSFTRMERFLILGSEGGTYYVGEHDLTKQNVDNVRACIDKDAGRAIQMIVDVSVGGRAPKNDPALYALALAASYGPSVWVREQALGQLRYVARTGTHLFTFCEFIDSMRGWGPALRRNVADWYQGKTEEKLAYQLVKYQQRNGWSHRDVMRLAHPKPPSNAHKALYKWVVKGELDADDFTAPLVHAFEQAKHADEKTVVRLIREYGLTREMIPTEHQKSKAVWEALLENMPLTAMVRTLGRMGSVGLLTPLSKAVGLVTKRLHDADYLHKSRVHPIQILTALLTYKQGHGTKGSLTWPVVPQVVDALNDAFYLSFDNVEPTGKRFMLGIDVSGSMTSGQMAGVAGLTPNMGAAAMAMLIARTEDNYFIGGFATQFVDLGISRADRLDAAMRKAQRSFGGTDCATPIKYAMANKISADVFVVITDGETWAGDVHNAQAIVQYRRATGIDAKMIVINMVSNHSSLVDVTDAGSLDVVGFDTSVPTLISSFVTGGRKGRGGIAIEDGE